MRSTRVLGIVVAVAMAMPSMLLAQDANRPQPQMQAMQAAFRTLNMQIADATKVQDNLKLLQEFEAAVIASKNLVPPMVAALPAAEQPARITEYKKVIVKLLKATLEVEDALLAGDSAKAQTALAALGPIQQEGHRGFRPARGGGAGGGRRGGGAPGGAPPAGGGAPPAQ